MFNKIILFVVKKHLGCSLPTRGFKVARGKKVAKKKTVAGWFTKIFHFFEKKHLGCSLLPSALQFALEKKLQKKRSRVVQQNNRVFCIKHFGSSFLT